MEHLPQVGDIKVLCRHNPSGPVRQDPCQRSLAGFSERCPALCFCVARRPRCPIPPMRQATDVPSRRVAEFPMLPMLPSPSCADPQTHRVPEVADPTAEPPISRLRHASRVAEFVARRAIKLPMSPSCRAYRGIKLPSLPCTEAPMSLVADLPSRRALKSPRLSPADVAESFLAESSRHPSPMSDIADVRCR